MAKISIIVALAANNAIGKGNDLLCHIPGDLKRFKALTINHSVIMGRNTYESLPNGPLKERRNIVLTHSDIKIDGCEMANSLEQALELTKNEDEVFVIGGGKVYNEALKVADKLYLTLIHKDFDGDVFFPEIDYSQWKELSKETISGIENCDFSFSYVNYERI